MTHATLFPPVETAVKYGFPRWDITAQDGDTLVSIARVLPVGSKADRQANAERLALCWNTHDDLKAQNKAMLEAMERLSHGFLASLQSAADDAGEDGVLVPLDMIANAALLAEQAIKAAKP